jgi:hypothetical protein
VAYLRLQASSCARLLSCFALPFVDLPEDYLEFLLTRIKFRISRNNRTAVRPICFILHQLSSYRIGQDIRTRPAKGVSLTLLRPKHLVVWLVPPLTVVGQIGLKMSTQELHCIKLVTLVAQPHPNQSEDDQASGSRWTNQMGTSSGVKHQFAEACVKRNVELSPEIQYLGAPLSFSHSQKHHNHAKQQGCRYAGSNPGCGKRQAVLVPKEVAERLRFTPSTSTVRLLFLA